MCEGDFPEIKTIESKHNLYRKEAEAYSTPPGYVREVGNLGREHTHTDNHRLTSPAAGCLSNDSLLVRYEEEATPRM